jgi:hypothetical protein
LGHPRFGVLDDRRKESPQAALTKAPTGSTARNRRAAIAANKADASSYASREAREA